MTTNSERCAVCGVDHHEPGAPACKSYALPPASPTVDNGHERADDKVWELERRNSELHRAARLAQSLLQDERAACTRLLAEVQELKERLAVHELPVVIDPALSHGSFEVPRRYRSDDRDEKGGDNELVISMGGNGDWYLSIVARGERLGRSVRLTTSGTPRGCEGVPTALANLYKALPRS
jgi:hypothetical protein